MGDPGRDILGLQPKQSPLLVHPRRPLRGMQVVRRHLADFTFPRAEQKAHL